MALDRYLTDSEARYYADLWISAWQKSERSLLEGAPLESLFDALLELYGTEILYNSPYIAELFPDHKHRIISGLGALKNYFTLGLQKYRHQPISLKHVYAGYEGFCITYEGFNGRLTCEQMTMNDHMKIKKSYVYYAVL